MSGRIRITQKKSAIGEKPRTREVLCGLGLRRISCSVEREDTPSIRGMVAKVRHLVTVEVVPSADAGSGDGRR